jgi:hypothetical protein
MRCTADSYTEEELRRCSLWALTDFSGAQSIFVGLRDRAMLLFSSTTAFRGENSRCCSGLISSGRQCPGNSQQRWRYVGSVPHAVRVYAEDDAEDRSLLSSPTMPNTTSMVAWTNMGPSGTVTSSSVLSEPLHFSSLHTFMFCIAHRPISHPTSCGRTVGSTDTGSGTTTSSSMLECPARRCHTTVSWSHLLVE